MSNRYRRRGILASVTVGWLFADMLLALAMLFLTANTITVIKQPTPTPTATPTPTPTALLKPTPTPVPRLETVSHRIEITISADGLLAGSSDATNSVKQQLRAQSILQKRDVGIAIVYDGAPNASDISRSQSIDDKIYEILRQLGQDGFAFSRASYYDDLFVLGTPQSQVSIDVYLFK